MSTSPVAQESADANHTASPTGPVSFCGYLFKYRNHGIGLFSSHWQLRYLALSGSVVHVYKGERDVSFFPRAMVDVQGCRVEVEGVKRARYHTLRVVDASHATCLRLSTEDAAAFRAWCAALTRATAATGTGASRPRSRAAPSSPQHHVSGASSASRLSEPCDASDGLPVPAASCAPRAGVSWQLDSSSVTASPTTQFPLGEKHLPRLRLAPSQSHASFASELSVSCHSPIAENSVAATEPSPSGAPPRTGPPSATPGPPAASGSAAEPAQHARPRRGAAPLRPMALSEPLHVVPRYSYLSSERIWHQQHAGLVNLGMVIIVAANSRLVLENVLKYGLRADPLRWLHGVVASARSTNQPVVLSLVALLALALAALGVERLASRSLRAELAWRDGKVKKEAAADSRRAAAMRSAAWRTELAAGCLHLVVSYVLPLALPILVIVRTEPDPAPAFLLMICAFTVWTKLISYSQCNSDYRTARRKGVVCPGERGSTLTRAPTALSTALTPVLLPTVAYPENLTLADMLYFLVIPTLTYQANYPRTSRIRRRWLARRVAEAVIYAGVLLLMIDQYVEPAILNSLRPLRESNIILVTERVLKLSLPCMYVWLVMFYLVFHVWFNILAEVTRFADREFYKDWWNATTIGEYWRLWNQPVHRWIMRSIFAPLMRIGLGKYGAGLGAFFISAVMHELAIGVPLRMVRYWAFGGMIAQLPLVYITEMLKLKLRNDRLGNIIFWISFCIIGQPMCALLYYHDYLLEHSPSALGRAALDGHSSTSPALSTA